MHITLLESNRRFLHSAEYAALSIVAHAALLWSAAAVTAGGGTLPTDEREARAFFLLPPDRADLPMRQSSLLLTPKLGDALQGGPKFVVVSDAGSIRQSAYGSDREGERIGAAGSLRLGRDRGFSAESVFSVLQVDQMVQRFETSAAPVYPPLLIASGVEGQVQATYVVDTLGRVDTTTIVVLQSDHALFSQSVRTALALMHFKPAKRAGRTVRQLVAQRFRFKISPTARPLEQSS